MTEDDRLPLWVCEDCGTERRSNPLAHSDWGGVITVYGPDCPECECPMAFDHDPADNPAPEARP